MAAESRAAVLLALLALLLLLSSCRADRRHLSVEVNPGLNSSMAPPPPGVTLLHIRALGDGDTLHFLLGGLWVEPESSVLSSQALVLFRLWEYDDSNDTADPQEVPASSFLPPYELQNFQWEPLDNRSLDPLTPTVRLCGGDGTPAFSNGSFCLQGLRPRAGHSRFLLELHALGRPYDLPRVEIQQSIDDEYTPSIFTVSQWLAAPTNWSSPVLGYVQWKPVAYRQPQPVFTDATPCRHSSPVAVSQNSFSALALAFYGAGAPATGLNISYGLAGEPFYNATDYLSWSVLVGIGEPPVDSFSPLVLSIMAVGLGSPLLLLLMGGVFICIRRRSLANQQAYHPIN
ncbi:hypothetical protein CRUP_009353 [Coryphaenoides rupestris]|nr:hypothetical protein CRUP_009353 [Coryphaenoides rupestris]